MPKVYSLGYAQAGSLQRLEALMELPSTLLIDTRIKPVTKYYPWHFKDLKKRWGERYIQAGEEFLGNPNAFSGGPLAMVDPVGGINKLLDYLSRGFDIILLCGCKNYRECHRSLIMVKLLTAILRAHLDVEIVPEPVVEIMKCYSIKPPFSNWIVWRQRFVDAHLPPKMIENREGTTKHRTTSPATRVLVHSSHSTKTYIHESIEEWTWKIPGLDKIIPMSPEGYSDTAGKIIGVADLTDIVEESDDPWFLGTYGWVFQNAQLLKEPISYRGNLGLFDVPTDVVRDMLPSGVVLA